jgi:glucose/arabinose dehydrogenase
VLVSAVVAAIAMALPLAPIGDFRQPVHVTGTSAQPRTAFVLERSGRVWRVGPRGRRLFLDARRFVRLREPRNQREDQGGAFALAVPPRHRPGGAVYLLYTRRDGRVHLDEFRPRRSHRSPTPRTVLSERRTSAADVGGDVAFGPDRLLYASFGFGHSPHSSQDPATLAGKLVRVNPRAEEPRAQVVASGMRVPWRFSFDVPTETLIASDVGEVDFEEVNVLRLGVDEPANLGWPFFEGRNRRLAGGPAGPTQPVLAVRHGARMCAIVGGFLMRGPAPPRLRGRYVYGDVCSGQLRSVRLTHGHARDDRSERTVVPYLVSFGRDGRGRLYAVSLNGRVFRVL